MLISDQFSHSKQCYTHLDRVTFCHFTAILLSCGLKMPLSAKVVFGLRYMAWETWVEILRGHSVEETCKQADVCNNFCHQFAALFIFLCCSAFIVHWVYLNCISLVTCSFCGMRRRQLILSKVSTLSFKDLVNIVVTRCHAVAGRTARCAL